MSAPTDPFTWPEQRVGLFVDTQNLYYGARDGADAGGRQVDYATLLTLAAGPRRLAQATAYVVERSGEATAYGFITKLSALGYRVRRRTLRLRRLDDGGRPVLDGDWDMGIAADMVRAWEGLGRARFGERRRRLRAYPRARPSARFTRRGARVQGNHRAGARRPSRPFCSPTGC